MTARISSGPDSSQEYGTPWKVLNAIRKHFPLGLDLCANEQNHKCPRWFGPGGEVEDAFSVNWDPLPRGEFYFLNPPYGDIASWYARARIFSGSGALIISFVPMDTAEAWFNYVPYHVGIWHLQGRIKFDGALQAGPKDSCLHIWGPTDHINTFRVWNWRTGRFLLEIPRK